MNEWIILGLYFWCSIGAIIFFANFTKAERFSWKQATLFLLIAGPFSWLSLLIIWTLYGLDKLGRRVWKALE